MITFINAASVKQIIERSPSLFYHCWYRYGERWEKKALSIHNGVFGEFPRGTRLDWLSITYRGHSQGHVLSSFSQGSSLEIWLIWSVSSSRAITTNLTSSIKKQRALSQFWVNPESHYNSCDFCCVLQRCSHMTGL